MAKRKRRIEIIKESLESLIEEMGIFNVRIRQLSAMIESAAHDSKRVMNDAIDLAGKEAEILQQQEKINEDLGQLSLAVGLLNNNNEAIEE